MASRRDETTNFLKIVISGIASGESGDILIDAVHTDA
jgi:hypothetical protein